jgi:Ca-activated chloride channel family protein
MLAGGIDMNIFRDKSLAWLLAKLNGTKLGVGVLFGLSGATALAVLPRTGLWPRNPTVAVTPPGVVPPATAPVTVTTADGVRLRVKSAQEKVVQGAPGELYVQVDVDVPAVAAASTGPRRATDLVLVLDRSGSMADGDKLTFAKAAMRSLLDRLTEVDRVGLVTFDGVASVAYPLAYVTADTRGALAAVIERLGPGGSTNIEAGLGVAERLMPPADAGRSHRMVLLSDGMATTGLTDPTQLAALASAVSRAGAVVSTIGMGLEFNEALLSRMADQGMGNYTYLETLATLGQVLEKDLDDARAQFAASSTLKLGLGSGVTVVDAGGYPLQTVPGGVEIPLGQLLGGTTRSLTLSLRGPVAVLGEHELTTVALGYVKDGRERVVRGGDVPLRFAVVAPERAQEAMASVDGAVLRQAWTANNLGRAKKEFAENLRDGRRDEAEKVIADFRAKVQGAAASSGVALDSKEVDDALADMGAMAKDVAAAPAAEQGVKMKAYAKQSLSGAIKSQRATKVAPPTH